MMKRMRLEDIKINEAFANTTPSEEKMNECREFWRYERKQDRPIVLNSKGVLVDGYVMYCVLKEHKEEYAEVIRKKKHNRKYERLPKVKPSYKNSPTTYIFGIHPNSENKEVYTWRVPASWENWVENVEIGDTIFCQTKFGISPVVVQEVECLSKCPVGFEVKKVASRKIKRNSVTV